MKFAHSFSQLLQEEDFPADWQAAAIRYGQLKKCIKKVQSELLDLGLTVEVLKRLVEEAESPIVKYMFDGTVHSFQPKLVLTIDAVNGIPPDPNLPEDTRQSLENLVRRKLGKEEVETKDVSSSLLSKTKPHVEPKSIRTVEITLFSDSEFFHLLTSEITSLEALQSRSESEIRSHVLQLGQSVTAVAAPKLPNNKSDLYPWREIFRIYLECGIFFSNLEIESHQERTVEKATERLTFFADEIRRLGIQAKFKNPYSPSLFKMFLSVNMDVLRVMRFRDINRTAMTKILKKFDKRTALGVRQAFPIFITPTGPLASHLSKAICHTLCTSLLNVIPQLDDYLCPICSSISIKPVRLSCSHIFCVRCLVKLQRANKDPCPMCRSKCVLSADSGNLDVGLYNFLKQYFPKEVKIKQAENEREVAIEHWRNIHSESCQIRLPFFMGKHCTMVGCLGEASNLLGHTSFQ
ncbi:RING-14 protein-like protein [Choiromyces venosus 120613-1]|uniref:RING-14 protein-like protein n=1 Tax=Choiromyces venosus 120613-1 TaxID=1336337 RepID=A0A3N4JYU5_9PEZI|nr:RING-14 protein-like protein [Choiromyces venosus 120613-1]